MLDIMLFFEFLIVFFKPLVVFCVFVFVFVRTYIM